MSQRSSDRPLPSSCPDVGVFLPRTTYQRVYLVLKYCHRLGLLYNENKQNAIPPYRRMGPFGLYRYILERPLHFRLYWYAAVPGYEGTRGTRYHCERKFMNFLEIILVLLILIASKRSLKLYFRPKLQLYIVCTNNGVTRPPAIDDSRITGTTCSCRNTRSVKIRTCIPVYLSMR